MKRFLLIAALFSLACGLLTPGLSPVIPTDETAVETPVPPPASTTSIPTLVPSPTLPLPPTGTPQLSPSPAVSPPAETSFSVRYHPDGGLFVGDKVSLEVIAPPEADLEEKEIIVEVIGEELIELGKAAFSPFGIAGRSQATFRWAWDTQGWQSGEYQFSFSIIPDGLSWTESVVLHPQALLPPTHKQAGWETKESECCIVYYITGTAAERDLEELLQIADEQARLAARRMGVDFKDPIPITLLPRVLGHGGFAGGEIYISYLDRNYAGNDFAQVLHHEMVHILDGRLGGDLRPTILVEGLAVYLTGGHFKVEPIMSRTAALLDMGIYLPLQELTDDFYPSQHEIGYLQGAALVKFMIDTWGWDSFSAFYRDIHPHPSDRQAQAMDAALQGHFGLSYAQLEQLFISELRRQHIIPDMRADILLTIEYYDTVRRYQQALDPAAYFLTAWLPGGEEMRQNGIVADYLRHPTELKNLSLEALLVNADRLLRSGDYAFASQSLNAVKAVLDALAAGDSQPFARNALANDYFKITSELLDNGYVVYNIQVEETKARALASLPGRELIEAELVRSGDGWRLRAGETGEIIWPDELAEVQESAAWFQEFPLSASR
jgi:hypothetical protein